MRTGGPAGGLGAAKDEGDRGVLLCLCEISSRRFPGHCSVIIPEKNGLFS